MGCHEGPEGLTWLQPVGTPNRVPRRTCGTSLERHLSDVGVFTGKTAIGLTTAPGPPITRERLPSRAPARLETHGSPLALPHEPRRGTRPTSLHEHLATAPEPDSPD